LKAAPYLSELRGSPYFVEQAPLKDAAELQTRLQSGQVNATAMNATSTSR
jgi:ribosome-dependent ATPase